MSLQLLIDALPPYAGDVARGLAALDRETARSPAPQSSASLAPAQLWGCVLASAHAVGTPAVLRLAEAGALEAGLSEVQREAARGAAAVMAQNNVYFRAIELIEDPALEAQPSRLRMHAVHHPQVPSTDMHLMCLAVSAINGCGACMKSHTGALRALGVEPATQAAAVRVGALVNAACRVLASHPPLYGEGQPA